MTYDPGKTSTWFETFQCTISDAQMLIERDNSDLLMRVCEDMRPSDTIKTTEDAIKEFQTQFFQKLVIAGIGKYSLKNKTESGILAVMEINQEHCNPFFNPMIEARVFPGNIPSELQRVQHQLELITFNKGQKYENPANYLIQANNGRIEITEFDTMDELNPKQLVPYGQVRLDGKRLFFANGANPDKFHDVSKYMKR